MEFSKKILAWICILFLCLAGCGKNQSGQSGSSQSPSENSSDVSSDTAKKDEDQKDESSSNASNTDNKDENAAGGQNSQSNGNGDTTGLNTGKTDTMSLTIGDKKAEVTWENNESVEALKQMSPLTVQLTPYGGVELTGNIGTTIPSTYSVITANPGDIVLLEGNTLIVMVESKTCQYTKIGKITNLSESELKDLLSKGNVTITLEL